MDAVIDRFVRGAGGFTADLHEPGMLHACFLRSPHPHAGIGAIDTTDAVGMPGVRLVLTGRDPAVSACRPLGTTPLKGIVPPEWRILPAERVRHVGQAVALVVADSEEQARDAAERIAIAWNPLPPVLDPEAGEVALHWELGDRSATAAALDRAAHVVRITLANQRIAPAALEPRAALAMPEGAGFRLVTPSQGAAILQGALVQILGWPAERLRVLTPDVGGAFGSRTAPCPEQPLLLLAAEALKRPVRWVASRGEAFLSDSQGRGNRLTGTMAFDGDGRILALEAASLQNLGAFCTAFGPLTATGNFAACLSGCYAIPAMHVAVTCALTHQAPHAPYRGAGRPEANYLLERLIDKAAGVLGLDSMELRRRNLVPGCAMPYRTALGQTYDSGDFLRLLEEAEHMADRAGFAARRRDSAAHGRLRGFGMALYLEASGGLPFESAGLRFAQGRVALLAGGQASGQGQAVSLVRVLAGALGVAPGRVDFVQGDSARLPGAGPSVASRTMAASGSAIVAAAAEAVAKGLPVAAGLLQADPKDLIYGEGFYRAGEAAVSLWDVAERISLDVTTKINVAPTYPNGCHFAEVEIDPRTGEARVARYGALDDVGNAINPDAVAGQLHGGVAQGIGQALMETVIYDPAGQMLTGSFMDYPLPRAADVPPIAAAEFHGAPCTTNPLGAKGAGEGGTTGALAPLMLAVNDALAQAGAPAVEMPATPARIWRSLRHQAGQAERDRGKRNQER